MTTPDQLPTATGVEETKDQADRLGLTWQIREATVTQVVSSNSVLATYDGDTESKPMILIGPRVLAGDRVYVVFVPPQGNYVIGSMLYMPGIKLLTMGLSGGTQVASTASAAEIAFTDYVIDVPLIAGHLTLILLSIQIFVTPLATDQILGLRIREDTILGTAIATAGAIPRGNVFTDWIVPVLFVAGTTELQRYVATAQRNTGTATWGVNAATHNFFAAFDLGRPLPGTVFTYP